MLLPTVRAFADPGDVVITLTIPAAKVADFRAGFLAEKPVPQIQQEVEGVPQWDDEDETIPTMVNQYTEKQWFTLNLINYAKKIYRRGKNKLATQAAVIDNDVMQ